MINNSNFLVNEFPNFHPIAEDEEHKRWWRDFKRKCIEGSWSSGKWCPPNLYFYCNAWTIELQPYKGAKFKVADRPLMRDLEWEKALMLMEAHGFSGFSKDSKFTCDRKYGPDKEDALAIGDITQEDLKTKTYVPAREYLRKIHASDMGKPLFHNPCKNVVDLESRETGKSFSTAGMCFGHRFLFDGATDYDEYLKYRKTDSPITTQIMLGGAIDKYVNIIIPKFHLGMEKLPGYAEFYGEQFLSPLYVNYGGSLEGEKAYYKTKKSGTEFHVRTFSKGPGKAAGLRASYVGLEESSYMHNIRDVLLALKDVMSQDDEQSGVIHMFGTGAFKEGLSIDYIQEIFEDPARFNCLEWNHPKDETRKVGYFVPYEKALNRFKDKPNYITNMEKACLYVDKEYEKARKRGSKAILSHQVNRPRTPDHIFLGVSSNNFPIEAINNVLSRLISNSNYLYAGTAGSLVPSKGNDTGVRFKPDVEGRLQPIYNFPVPEQGNREGALIVYDIPREDAVPGMYIIGHDPVADDSSTGSSLASIYVMQTGIVPNISGNNTIVAEFIGRPLGGRNSVNQLLLDLALWYKVGDGGVYFENIRGNVKEFFERRGKLNLLAMRPEYILSTKAAYASRSTVPVYGFPISTEKHKADCESYAYDYLMEKRGLMEGSNILNIHTIRSVYLLRQLRAYNRKSNIFDAVIGFFGCLIGLEERRAHKDAVAAHRAQDDNDPIGLDFLLHNEQLFDKRRIDKGLEDEAFKNKYYA